MMPTVSVAICTHNPRKDHLERTLASMAAQDLPRSHWELMVIDNASTNGVCNGLDLMWHPNARLISEERIGLTMARLRAIEEAKGDLILFVDDDNVLQADYLTRLVALAERYPVLGVIGAGRIEPEYEEQPAPALGPYVHMLALRTVAVPKWSNDPRDQCVPWGAGMAVRRSVAERYREQIKNDPLKQRLDRSGGSMNSGGDDEFSWVACEMGLGKGVFPELAVVHLIRSSRVQRDYLLRLAEGHAYSHALLAHLHGARVPVPKAPPSWRKLMGHMLRLQLGETLLESTQLWRRRQRSEVKALFEQAYQDGVARFHKTIHD